MSLRRSLGRGLDGPRHERALGTCREDPCTVHPEDLGGGEGRNQAEKRNLGELPHLQLPSLLEKLGVHAEEPRRSPGSGGAPHVCRDPRLCRPHRPIHLEAF